MEYSGSRMWMLTIFTNLCEHQTLHRVLIVIEKAGKNIQHILRIFRDVLQLEDFVFSTSRSDDLSVRKDTGGDGRADA